jgi:hypothetical protein
MAFVVDRRPDGVRRGLQLYRSRHHLHGLYRGADLHFNIEVCCAAGVNDDRVVDGGLKSLRRRCKVVCPGRNVREDVCAFHVRCGRFFNAGRRVYKFQYRVGDRGAGRVADEPANRRCRHLSSRIRQHTCEGQRESDDKRDGPYSPHTHMAVILLTVVPKGEQDGTAGSPPGIPSPSGPGQSTRFHNSSQEEKWIFSYGRLIAYLENSLFASWMRYTAVIHPLPRKAECRVGYVGSLPGGLSVAPALSGLLRICVQSPLTRLSSAFTSRLNRRTSRAVAGSNPPAVSPLPAILSRADRKNSERLRAPLDAHIFANS